MWILMSSCIYIWHMKALSTNKQSLICYQEIFLFFTRPLHFWTDFLQSFRSGIFLRFVNYLDHWLFILGILVWWIIFWSRARIINKLLTKLIRMLHQEHRFYAHSCDFFPYFFTKHCPWHFVPLLHSREMQRHLSW